MKSDLSRYLWKKNDVWSIKINEDLDLRDIWVVFISVALKSEYYLAGLVAAEMKKKTFYQCSGCRYICEDCRI